LWPYRRSIEVLAEGASEVVHRHKVFSIGRLLLVVPLRGKVNANCNMCNYFLQIFLERGFKAP
jgi:hypothetical protein